MRPILSSVALCISAVSARGGEDPCERAEKHFASGELVEGRSVLMRALRDPDAPPGERARVMERLAWFYEELVGNFGEASKLSVQVLKLGLPADRPAKLASSERLARLKSYEVRFREENAILERVRVEPTRPGEMEARAAELRALVRERPGFPGRAAAYYYLGANLLALKRYGEACDAFRRATDLRPGLSYYLPVKHRERLAYGHWLRRTLSRTSRILLGLFVLASAALFYLARPWRRLGVRHLAVCVGAVVLWWAVFAVASRCLGGGVSAPKDEFEEPVFASGTPGSPGSEILGTLFAYGLVGTAGVLVLAAGTSRFRFRWTWAVLNAAAGAVLFGCLVAVFYLRHCDRGGLFLPEDGDRLSRLRGAAYFVQQDIEPFVLTDPMSYPGLQLENVDEPFFRSWVESHYRRAGEGKGR